MPVSAGTAFRARAGWLPTHLKGINMAELSGFIKTLAGPVPAIGGSEEDYRSAWPLIGKPIYEITRQRPPKHELIVLKDRSVDMRNWRLFAIDFGREFPEEFAIRRTAYFYDSRQDLTKLPPPSNYGRPFDYRFLEVCEDGSDLIALRSRISYINIRDNFRGFSEVWNSLKHYPWICESPLHKPIGLTGLVVTPYGTVPAVCGSSDDYRGTPWPFQHRSIPAYRALYRNAGFEIPPGPPPAADELEPMDLSLWTPVAINFGSVYDLPFAIFRRDDQLRTVTIKHGGSYRGPFWQPASADHFQSERLGAYFSHTKFWPAIASANDWLRPLLPDLIRRGFLWPNGWHPAHDLPDHANVEDWDGPAMPYSWKANGNVIADRMTPTAWRLVSYLWAQPRRISAYDQSLAEKVFLDHAKSVDQTRVGSHRRDANIFFKRHKIPWRVTAKRDGVELIPDQPD